MKQSVALSTKYRIELLNIIEPFDAFYQATIQTQNTPVLYLQYKDKLEEVFEEILFDLVQSDLPRSLILIVLRHLYIKLEKNIDLGTYYHQLQKKMQHQSPRQRNAALTRALSAFGEELAVFLLLSDDNSKKRSSKIDPQLSKLDKILTFD